MNANERERRTGRNEVRCRTPSGWLRSVAVVLGCGAGALLHAAIYDLSVGDSADRALRLNVPDSLAVVRGVLIYGNGANGDSRAMATDGELVALAESLGFAVLATSHWGYFADSAAPTELDLFETKLQQFATLSGHAELVRAPWLPIGHSNGGQMSYGLNALRPAKVIAMVVSKGGFYNVARPTAAALATPGLLVAGEADLDYRIAAIRDLFFGNRPRGARWAWVEDQGLDHAMGNSNELTLPFVEAMAWARYPAELSPAVSAPVLRPANESDGWLTDPNSYKTGLAAVASYATYAKDGSAAGWLPGRRLAFLFRAFASYDKATAGATLSSGAGPVDLGTSVAYDIGTPATAWTAADFYEGDTFLKRVASGSGVPPAVEAALTAPGYSVFHAVVTFADSTQRTTVPRRVFVRPAHGAAPSVGAITGAGTLALGDATTLRATAGGPGPWVWQWCKNGAPLAGATGDALVLAAAGGFDGGNYTVRVTGPGGTTESAAKPVAVAHPARLAALSVRTVSGPGNEVVILGFIVQGADGVVPKPLVIRGLGPGLARFGLTGFMADPRVRLFAGQTEIAADDDWDATAVRPVLSRIGLDNLEPGGRDAAFLTARPSGIYTAHIGAKTAERGVVLAEVYEADGAPVRLTAMSVRAQAGTGETTLIGGFIVTGGGTKRVIVRGLGPALGAAGVGDFLPDPKITLYSGTTPLAWNDNWANTPEMSGALAATGLTPPAAGSPDAALLAELPAGAYTVHLTGNGSAPGVALIEIYELP